MLRISTFGAFFVQKSEWMPRPTFGARYEGKVTDTWIAVASQHKEISFMTWIVKHVWDIGISCNLRFWANNWCKLMAWPPDVLDGLVRDQTNLNLPQFSRISHSSLCNIFQHPQDVYKINKFQSNNSISFKIACSKLMSAINTKTYPISRSSLSPRNLANSSLLLFP